MIEKVEGVMCIEVQANCGYNGWVCQVVLCNDTYNYTILRSFTSEIKFSSSGHHFDLSYNMSYILLTPSQVKLLLGKISNLPTTNNFKYKPIQPTYIKIYSCCLSNILYCVYLLMTHCTFEVNQSGIMYCV